MCPVANRLARCAEVAQEYLHKHFDWQGTTRAIHSLSPSSGLAILSRWRDRHFGWMQELLPTAIHFLVGHRYIDPITACALLGFRGQWRYHQLLDRALAACQSQPERQVVTEYVLRYMRLEECSVSAWQEVDSVSKAHALSIPDLDRLVEFSIRREQSLKNTRETHASVGSGLSHEEAAFDWESVFSDLELHTVNGLSSAYANFKCNDPPSQHKLFWTELIRRIALGKEAELVKAVSEAGEVDLYLFRSFIEQLPEKWAQRMAIKRALAEAIQQILRRHCLKITINRRYQMLPLKTASELSGLPETELIGTVLVAIGQQSDTLETGRLFTLVGLLASKLSHDEALEVLNFGLGLFEDVLDEEDGDGAWSAFLAPPPDMDEAVAGYLWAALGAPEADLRWQAAHMVRGLCALGRRETVDYLIQLASGSTAGSFADSRLHFYHLHARLWLMIALARSSLESPEVLATHSKFLVHYALRDDPHVLIRHFAASAALALEADGFIQLDAGVSSQLRAVNVSALPVVPSQTHELHRTPTHAIHRDSGSERFTFGDDMSRYWFGSLGNCFAKTPPEIALKVEQVILDDWKLTHNGNWLMDERARRGLYRGRETMHSHGSYPRTDSLNFYLSYHGMFTAAGKLLATVPLHQEPDEQESKFYDWLNQHLLSRKDGRWLADRRDPKPLEWSTWKDKPQDENWRWSVSRPDFDRLLGIGNDRLNLWGCWNTTSGSREELVHVYSALVSPDHSTALLRALQTATNPYSYRIPDAGDDAAINKANFQLQGWVENRYCESNLDKFDPWAGDIQYPSLRPTQFVCDLLLLTSDSEFRAWRRQTESGPKEVLWSQVWSNVSRDDDQSKSEHGRRLQATHAFMTDVLAKMNMDLIIQVEIERQMRRNGYGRYTNDGYEYIPPYFKLFLLRRSGEFDSI